MKNRTKRRQIMLYTLSGLVIVVIAMFITARRFLAPPQTVPDYSGERPSVEEEGYISHTDSILVNTPYDLFYEWVETVNLEDIAEGTDDFPSVVDTEELRGTFDAAVEDRTGARRMVIFDDGHYAAEEILESTGPVFRYMVWGFTGIQRIFIDHAIGEFVFEQVGDEQTRLTWTYSFQPSSSVFRPFLSSFVNNTWAEFMENVLEAYEEGGNQLVD